MDETFDGIFEGNEAEESEVMDKLYDEIGIEFSGKVIHMILIRFILSY